MYCTYYNDSNNDSSFIMLIHSFIHSQEQASIMADGKLNIVHNYHADNFRHTDCVTCFNYGLFFVTICCDLRMSRFG